MFFIESPTRIWSGSCDQFGGLRYRRDTYDTSIYTITSTQTYDMDCISSSTQTYIFMKNKILQKKGPFLGWSITVLEELNKCQILCHFLYCSGLTPVSRTWSIRKCFKYLNYPSDLCMKRKVPVIHINNSILMCPCYWDWTKNMLGIQCPCIMVEELSTCWQLGWISKNLPHFPWARPLCLIVF